MSHCVCPPDTRWPCLFCSMQAYRTRISALVEKINTTHRSKGHIPAEVRYLYVANRLDRKANDRVRAHRLVCDRCNDKINALFERDVADYLEP